MSSLHMYSAAWFGTFADAIEPEVTTADVAGISALCPPAEFPRLLEIGCGTGRVAGPLSAAGFDVVGVDINAQVLEQARIHAPGPTYLAMDQRQIGQLSDVFDAVIVLWNSIGFTSRLDDEMTLRGIASVLKPGGKFLIDLYHPDWLLGQSSGGVINTRGVKLRRFVSERRCFHIIEYPDGTVDDIQFNVYLPDEMISLARTSGFELISQMTWWNAGKPPSKLCARYQLEFVRGE